MTPQTTNHSPEFRNILDVVKRFPDEKSCREFLEKRRWNGQIACVKCGSTRKIYHINDGALYKCADCRKQFSVRVGTIFEDSALPLQKWFMAIYIFMAHKKGISSIQLGKDIGVTQKTAWFMLHRIRYAVRTRSLDRPLSGTVEVDEVYIGGAQHRHGTGRGTENKNIVLGMKQRSGEVRAELVPNMIGKRVQRIIRQTVAPGSKVYTDELHSYHALSNGYQHETVTHGEKEYVRGDIHTNGIESFWSMLQRGIYGIYHHVSKWHLDKYVDEFEFRQNSKDVTDPSRMGLMLSHAEGRLTYRSLVGE